MAVGCHRHTSHGIEHAYGDFAIGNQRGDVRQDSIDGIARSGIVF